MKKLKRGLKAKLMGVSKVRPIALDEISVDCILFDPSVAEIFYFKYDVGDSTVILYILIIFTGNPVVNMH